MSPRRRLFAIVLLVAAIAATVGVVVAGVFGDRSTPSAARAVPADAPGPVLLVPGYGGSVRSVAPLAVSLRNAGRDATVVELPDRAMGDLAAQARAVRSAADAVLRRTAAPSVDVVGYSAGGVVVRLWISAYGGGDVVRRVVTVAAPHHGTSLGELAGSLAPELCPVACQQLTSGSAVLAKLNRGDETPDGPAWLSMWSTADTVVTPPSSSRLDGAVNAPLQSVCPGGTVAEHGRLPADPLVIGLVRRSLGVAPIVAPTPRDCAPLRRLGSQGTVPLGTTQSVR